ncbi:hypothetical protein J6590_076799 [Homalodisca vitripennis]|nr:hypothetical protein J6590_076799 [Homalodisca vitripennis]
MDSRCPWSPKTPDLSGRNRSGSNPVCVCSICTSTIEPYHCIDSPPFDKIFAQVCRWSMMTGRIRLEDRPLLFIKECFGLKFFILYYIPLGRMERGVHAPISLP